MSIMRVDVRPFRRQFKTPLITAHGSISERRGVLIRLEAKNRVFGYGEAGCDLYGPADDRDKPEAQAAGDISLIVNRLLGDAIPGSMKDALSMLDSLDTSEKPAVRFGIETALCDVSSRAAGMPLADWLGNKRRSAVPVNYLCNRPVYNWNRLAMQVPAAGYRAIKVKVGYDDIDADIKFLAELRQCLGHDIGLRLDANRAWTYDQALRAVQEMKRFGIDYIEEPLAQFDANEITALHQETGVKIALDESLAEIDDVESTLDERICQILVLKPAVIGGLLQTLRLVELAGRYKCGVVVTSTYETEIGTAALLHLAATMPDPLIPCGLDTLRLFENADPALGRVIDGAVAVPGGAGIGTTIGWGNDA